ncbi:hypothetical protein ACFWUZ_22245 [Streptomyces sp. NPDC058646]|uniref:hypothetical protein n=1 Tax=Streptomyces sp. NPDC058646 TaxID=3346574 RepID=UPI00366A0A2B
MVERTPRNDHAEVTRTLPADTPPGTVSMMGDFHASSPGAHAPQAREGGQWGIAVARPGRSTHSARYLAAGDYWFNDEGSRHHDGPHGCLRT